MADSAQDSSHHSYPVQNFNNGEVDKRCPKAELYGKSEDTVWKKKKNGAHTPHLRCRYLSSGRRTYTPAHAHTCTPLALGQREAFLCAPVRACPAGGRGGGEPIRPAPVRLRAPPCPAAVCSRRGAYRETRQSTLRNGYPGREKPWRRFSQTPPDGARGSQFCLAARLGALGSLPIPRWPGGSGRSRPHGVDPGPLNPIAPSQQCRRRQERRRELGGRKDPKGLFGELPWRSLDARRWSSELAAARTHGHEGRAARPFNPEGPWVDLPAQGAGAPWGEDVIIKKSRREVNRLGGPICTAVPLS